MKLFHAVRILVASQLLAAAVWAADDAPVITLWSGDAPGSEGKTEVEKVRVTPNESEHVVSSIHHPSITVCLPTPEKNTGAAVVICPGGGHKELWMDHEGYAVARWLADHGIAGFVLKYRLARDEGSSYQIGIHSLADVQRAIRLVRSRASEWKVDPAHVGVIGFSAGGELAALASMQFANAPKSSSDPIDSQDAKPAFQALIYPGNAKAISPAEDGPPAFLVCGYDDRSDISEGLARLYLLFKRADIPAELHIYTGSGHGFGIRESNHAPSHLWPDRFREWLDDRGFLRKTN